MNHSSDIVFPTFFSSSMTSVRVVPKQFDKESVNHNLLLVESIKYKCNVLNTTQRGDTVTEKYDLTTD